MALHGIYIDEMGNHRGDVMLESHGGQEAVTTKKEKRPHGRSPNGLRPSTSTKWIAPYYATSLRVVLTNVYGGRVPQY